MFRVLQDSWRKNVPELIAAATGGLPDFVMSRTPGELSGIPVFCYHAVSGPVFESHLRFLRENGYFALTADELLTALHSGSDSAAARPPANSVVITFDDGLLNLYDTVFPLLRDYGTRAVAFIAPAFHTTRNARSRGGPAPGLPVCSWEQIETMHASGLVDFQSHTLEHRLVYDWPRGSPLSGTSGSACERLRGPALSLTDDFAGARDLLERRLGKRVRHLAFPQYNGTAAAVRAGRACGYEAFYWGVRPWRPINRAGNDLSTIVRLSGEFLPRLPGEGRAPLRTILRERYRAHGRRWLRRIVHRADVSDAREAHAPRAPEPSCQAQAAREI